MSINQLHLLNLLLRGLDSLANNSLNMNTNNPSNKPIGDYLDDPPQQQQQQQTFSALKHQFEQTFESLRQLYKCSPTASRTGALLPVHSQDSRYLMLVVGK